MNILWIYDQPLIPEAGGTERITSLISEGLSKRGHNTFGMLKFDRGTGDMTHDGKSIPDLYSFLKGNKIDIVINQIAYSEWLIDMFLEKGGEKWKLEGGKLISCLHFDPKNPSIIQLYRASSPLSLKTIHKWGKFVLLKSYYNRRQHKQEGHIYGKVYDKSDILVTLSSQHIPYIEKVIGRGGLSKITSINNPLTFPEILPLEELANKEKTMIVCARMSEYHKRISLILKAWERLHGRAGCEEWRLQLIGEGPDSDRYKRFVNDKNLPRVEFLGRCNPEPYYRKASILLLTSSAEGWGLAITEGLERGCVPVVMDSSPVYHEILKNGETGLLIRNGSVKAFAESIYKLMVDSERRKVMQAAALHDSVRFSITTTLDKWEKLIRRGTGTD